MSSDRRRHPRLSADLPARLVVAGRERPAQVKDICRDAALVESAEAAEIGATVALTVELGRGKTVTLNALVIRDAGSAPGGHAFAVLFSDLDPAAATEIEVLLARLEGEEGPPPAE